MHRSVRPTVDRFVRLSETPARDAGKRGSVDASGGANLNPAVMAGENIQSPPSVIAAKPDTDKTRCRFQICPRRIDAVDVCFVLRRPVAAVVF